MLKLFELSGAFYFDQLSRLLEGRGYEEISEELEKMIAEGKIEKVRSPSGFYIYRLPVVKKSKVELPKREGVLIPRKLAHPEDMGRVFEVMHGLKKEFTVNQVTKVFKDRGEVFSAEKTRNCFAHLLAEEKIVVTRTKVYMGKVYDLYQLVGGEDEYVEARKVLGNLGKVFTLDDFCLGYGVGEEEGKKALVGMKVKKVKGGYKA